MIISHRHKIAVVIPKYGLVGGAEGFAAELTERIATNEEKYDIHVFANSWQSLSDRITFHHTPIIRFPKFLTTPSFAFFANKEIAKTPFDLIHSHDRIFQTDLYTLHGIPHRIWSKDVRKKRRLSLFDRSTAWVEKKMVTSGRCRRFLAVSSLSRQIFLQEYPMDPSLIPIIHPGISVKPFNLAERESIRTGIRAPLGLLSTEPVILFVSMNFDIKGLDAVLAGLGRLHRRNPSLPFKLLVVGKGNTAHYQSIARKFGVGERVLFSGVVDKEKLGHIYMASDLYAMLSKFDTFGLVILEAMAASLPVLVSANVGARDIVEEGVNGFIVEDTSVTDAIADKFAALLDETRRPSMSQAAFQTASRYSWDETALKVMAIYDDLLQERHS